MIGFALGNGRSRLDIDLDKLKSAGTIYGCNALYRDFYPDVLISTDPPISEEIQNSGYSLSNVHYTRLPKHKSGAEPIDSVCRGWSSGPIAVRYACKQHSQVYIIGFDLTSPTDRINNVYAGTDCYRDSNSDVTYYGNWIGQICKVFTEFPNVNFTRVVDWYTETPKQWKNHPNYSELDMPEFNSWLNKLIQQDFTMSRTIKADNITLDGNVTITGQTTLGNVEEVTVQQTLIEDNFITLNRGGGSASGITPTDPVDGVPAAGIEVDRGDLTNAKLRYNETDDRWELTNDGVTYLAISATASGGGLENVVEDLTPQLGGDLDVNGQNIVSVSNGDITVVPDGTGKLILNTYIRMEQVASAPSMAAGYATIYADTLNIGGSGVFVSNSLGQDELITRKKAIVFSIVF